MITDAYAICQPNTSYDPRRVRVATELCQASYSGRAWEEACAKKGFDAGYLSGGPTSFGYARLGKAHLIAVTGSNSLGDWIDNLDVRFRGVGLRGFWVNVHRGHWRQAERTAGLIAELLSTGEQVVWMGHSLGATVADHMMLQTPMSVLGYYSLAGARPGDRLLHEYSITRGLDKVTDRIVGVWSGEPDLVTRVWLSRAGYWHIPGRVSMMSRHVVDDGGKPKSEYKLFSGKAQWENFRRENPVSRTKALGVLARLAWSVQAHAVGEYVTAAREIERASAGTALAV